MIGPIRWSRAMGRCWLAPAVAIAALFAASVGWSTSAAAQEPPSPAPEAEAPKPEETPKPDNEPATDSDVLVLPNGEKIDPFVPLHPRTVEDRKQTEVVRLFGVARALEARRAFADAAEVLLEADKLDPDSVAIARRLCRLYIGPLARPDLAVDYGKRALEADPSDTDTLERLFNYYIRKNDFQACETLLRDVLANPNLEEHAPGRLVAQVELGRLYASRLNDVEKAADAYAEVVKGLDDRSANRLSPGDLHRVLGDEPAMSYLGFGVVFLAAQRDDLAIKAFERGLVYDETNPQIPLLLAETLLKTDKGDRALALVDRYIKRQPQGVEAYDLLAKVLTALHREDEITPRLEEAAARDSKNVPLQYVLADRYRETGQVEKAEALYKQLLTSQPTPQTYRALSASLLKRRKAGDLLKVICEAVGRPQGFEAVMPQLQAAAADDELAERMLDEGLKLLSADPPELPPAAFTVLGIVANPDRTERKPARLERLLKLQRLKLQKDPNPKDYLEIADTQQRMDQYAEAAATLEEMMEKFPGEVNPRYLTVLSSFYRRSNQSEKALEAVRRAVKMEPNDSEIQAQLATVLGDLGKLDEAVPIFEKVIKAEPDNPMYEFMLGALLIKYERNDEAIKFFEDMLKRNASKDEVVKLIHSNLSIIYVNQGDYARGQAELEKVFERFPDDPGVNNDLGYLYAEQGKNLEKAEAMIRKALQDDPDNYAFLDSLGWVLFKRGKYQEALEPLEKAVELHKQAEMRGMASPDATLPDHLGDVYLQLQDVEKARNIWRQAEEAAANSVPPDKRLEEIRKKLNSLDEAVQAPKPSTTETP